MSKANQKPTRKVYITKHATTQGIQVMYAEQPLTPSGGICVPPTTNGGFTTYFYGNDWHSTLEEARVRAKQMLTAKIASLQKSLAKMQKLLAECDTMEPQS